MDLLKADTSLSSFPAEAILHKSQFLFVLALEGRVCGSCHAFFYKNLSLHEELYIIISGSKEEFIHHSFCLIGTLKACLDSTVDYSGGLYFISPTSRLTVRNIPIHFKHLIMKSQPV